MYKHSSLSLYLSKVRKQNMLGQTHFLCPAQYPCESVADENLYFELDPIIREWSMVFGCGAYFSLFTLDNLLVIQYDDKRTYW